MQIPNSWLVQTGSTSSISRGVGPTAWGAAAPDNNEMQPDEVRDGKAVAALAGDLGVRRT